MPRFVPQSGDFSQFYSGNMASPDIGPGGTLVQSQGYGQPTTLQEVYRNIYPVGSFAPQATDARAEQTYGRNRGTIASSVSDSPLGAVYSGQNGAGGYGNLTGQQRTLVAQGMPPQIPGPNGYTSMTKDQSRLDTPYGFAFAGDQTAPGIAAIQGATTPSIPLPRVRPDPWDTMNGRMDAGGPFGGGWGSSAFFGRLPSGNPGQTDWSVANQGGAGLNGPLNAPSSLPPNRITIKGGTPMLPSLPIPRGVSPAVHAALMAQQERNNTTPYSQSPAGLNPAIHQQLMAQQSSDQRGKGALDAAGTLKILGF